MPGAPEPARALMHRFWGAMQETAPPFQQVFHDLVGGGLPERLRASPLRPLFETAAWAEVIEGLRELPPSPGLSDAVAHPAPDGAGPETLLIAEVEAIWSAIDRDDDWSPLAAKIDRIRRAGALNAGLGLLAVPTRARGTSPCAADRPLPHDAGSSTLSITWITPFDCSTSAMVTSATLPWPSRIVSMPSLAIAVRSQPPTVLIPTDPP